MTYYRSPPSTLSSPGRCVRARWLNQRSQMATHWSSYWLVDPEPHRQACVRAVCVWHGNNGRRMTDGQFRPGSLDTGRRVRVRVCACAWGTNGPDDDRTHLCQSILDQPLQAAAACVCACVHGTNGRRSRHWSWPWRSSIPLINRQVCVRVWKQRVADL
jgi:hypothetical protein